jgi:hypothetical protein
MLHYLPRCFSLPPSYPIPPSFTPSPPLPPFFAPSLLLRLTGQQEEEYEDELRHLIAAAETELVTERETITKLRALVQMKNTKVDQLKKKLVELSCIFKARQVRKNREGGGEREEGNWRREG